MLRTRPVCILVSAILNVATMSHAAQPAGLKVGETLKGDLTTTKHYTTRRLDTPKGFNRQASYYTTEVPLKLKAGQSIEATATVMGTGRMVGLLLLDPNGKRLDAKEHAITLEVTSSRISVDEVNATGAYKVVVISDATGPFTLVALDSSAPTDRQALEARLRELKLEIEEVEAKLKALDEKAQK